MSDDYDRVADLWHGIAQNDTERMIYLSILGSPWSKSRPKFSRTRVYQDPKDLAAEQATRLALRVGLKGTEPFTGNVAVACIFYRPSRQRIDADNLLKHVCDSGTGAVWQDDSQVTAIAGIVEYDKENPRTIVMMGSHESSMTRGTDAVIACLGCGKDIKLPGRTGVARYCSHRCYLDSEGIANLSIEVPCSQCGKPFRRGTSSQQTCGYSCASRRREGKKKLTARPPDKCQDCGCDVSKRGYVRCRACWRISRQKAA